MAQPNISPLSKLQTIKFVRLVNRDTEEVNRMVQICIDDGFFYLDLTLWNNGTFINSLDECNQIIEQWFKKPIEDKAKTITLSDAHGFKLVGQQLGVNEGQRDGYESLRVCCGPLLHP